MGGSNTGGGAGGNTGADAGFFISEQKKKEKINDSLIGGSDYQGDVNPQKKSKKKATITYDDGGSDNNNTIAQVTKTAPTVAEVSQATTTKAAEDTEANRLLKIKKKGRSMMMMSGSQGVTKMAADYSLGKKSLLGRV